MVPLPALPNLILFPTLFKCPTCLTLPSISALVKCTHQQDNTLFQPSTILVRFITTAPFLCEACPNPSPDAQYIIALLHSQRISIFLFGFISYTIFLYHFSLLVLCSWCIEIISFICFLPISNLISYIELGRCEERKKGNETEKFSFRLWAP